MNPSDRHTPARALGKVLNINGIKCVALKGADTRLQAKPGIYVITGKTRDGLFCYIGLATVLGFRPFEHIDQEPAHSVNERMANFKREYAPDKESRKKCISVLCIETHNYTGMDADQRRHYRRDREVFHWEIAKSIFGDARMLNGGKPRLEPLIYKGITIRQRLPNGGIIDWESARQFRQLTQIAQSTLADALDNKNGKLYGFRIEIVPSVEHPYDPKKHKPEDYKPAPGQRGSAATPFRQHLTNGDIIDWESGRQFCKMAKVAPSNLRIALETGELFGFRVEIIPAVEHPYDPKKHTPETYQPAFGLRAGEAKPIRQNLPNGGIIDWENFGQFAKMTKISHSTLKDALENKNGRLYEFRVEYTPAVEYPYDAKKHKPEDYQPAFGQRPREPMPIRQYLPKGGFIDWASYVQFFKMTRIPHVTLKAALEKKNGELFGFRLEMVSAVERPYDPARHKPEDYQPAFGQRCTEAKPVRQYLPNGGIIDWPSGAIFQEMTKISKTTLKNKAGKLFEFRVERIPAVEYPYNPKKHKPEDYQRRKNRASVPLNEPLTTLAAGRVSSPSPAKKNTLLGRIDAVLNATKTLLDSVART